MSYHNDPYRVDYLKIYPCLKERPDVLEVLNQLLQGILNRDSILTHNV